MIRVQELDFDVGAEIAGLTAGKTGIGGVVTFTGLVRDFSEGREIAEIELEHYPAMTLRELERIEAEARRRWPIDDCLIIHRHGRLKAGDRIVLVATASAHRQAAFDAAQFLIDWLKTRAPFWKRELTADGEEAWVEARGSDDQAAARWDQD